MDKTKSIKDKKEYYRKISFSYFTGVDIEDNFHQGNAFKNDDYSIDVLANDYNKFLKKLTNLEEAQQDQINQIIRDYNISLLDKFGQHNFNYCKINPEQWLELTSLIASSNNPIEEKIKSLGTISYICGVTPRSSLATIYLSNYIPIHQFKDNPFASSYMNGIDVMEIEIKENKNYFNIKYIAYPDFTDAFFLNVSNILSNCNIKIINANFYVRKGLFGYIDCEKCDFAVINEVKLERLNIKETKQLSINNISSNKKDKNSSLTISNTEYVNCADSNFAHILIKGSDSDVKEIIFKDVFTKDDGVIFLHFEDVTVKAIRITNENKSILNIFDFNGTNITDILTIDVNIHILNLIQSDLPEKSNFDGCVFEEKSSGDFSSIRRIMGSHQNYLEEERFSKLELRAKRNLKNTPWFEKKLNRAYEILFDYGYGIWQPLLILGLVWFVFAIDIDKFFDIKTAQNFPYIENFYIVFGQICDALDLGESFKRTSPFTLFGIGQDCNKEPLHTLQSLLSTALWFMLLLSIRNNFKIRW